MQKNYNHMRLHLRLPEYGRHIQEMATSLLAIDDRARRNRQAKAVIAVMGNLNPLLRDTADFTHKLWDHLFMMTDFRLDVDSPYPRPTREQLVVTPARMPYTQSRIAFKHYGKYVQAIVGELSRRPQTADTARTVDCLARFMRTKSYEYNQEHPSNEAIIRDLRRLSDGQLELDEKSLGALHSEYKTAPPVQPQQQRRGNNKQRQGRNKQRGR